MAEVGYTKYYKILYYINELYYDTIWYAKLYEQISIYLSIYLYYIILSWPRPARSALGTPSRSPTRRAPRPAEQTKLTDSLRGSSVTIAATQRILQDIQLENITYYYTTIGTIRLPYVQKKQTKRQTHKTNTNKQQTNNREIKHRETTAKDKHREHNTRKPRPSSRRPWRRAGPRRSPGRRRGTVAGPKGGRDRQSERDKWGQHQWGHCKFRVFWQRGSFWVLRLTCFYLLKSAKAYLFPQSDKLHYFCSGPMSVDPICLRPR